MRERPGTNRSRAAERPPVPLVRGSPSGGAGPGHCGVAPANGPGECRERIGEVVRRTAAQVRHATVPSGDDEQIERGLREALEPLLQEVESLNERIQEYDRRIEKMAKETYPETTLLKQVKGVGDLIATAYVLTIEDRIASGRVATRDVSSGCSLGGGTRARANHSCTSAKKEIARRR